MRLRLLISTICLTAALVGASPAPAIVDGKLDREAHDYVGVVLVLGGQRCTGTLMAPDRVVTAAHCFLGAQVPGNQVLFTLDNPAPHPGASPQSYVHGVATIYPGFPAGAPFANDVAVIDLDVDYPGANRFAKLPKLGVVDDMRAKNHKAHIVGYGLLGWDGAAPIGAAPPWERYNKHISLLEGTEPNHVMLERAACQGDSGGPSVRGSHVVAITSFTLTPFCTGEAFGYRLDTTDAQAFLSANGVR